MPVTKRVMAPGSFSIQLRPDTPSVITDQLSMDSQAFGHIIILPARLRPQGITANAALALSVFTGVMTESTNRTTIAGNHCSVLLGDADGKGQLPEADATATQSFSAWMTALKPASVLSTGAYEATATTLAWTWNTGQSRRDAIQYVCDYFGWEWRVSDDLKLSGDNYTVLYAAFAQPVITPWMEGRDVVYTSIRGTFSTRTTAEDFTSKTLVIDDAGALGTATIGSNPFQDQLGVDYSWKRYIDGGATVAAGTAGSVATKQLARFDGLNAYTTVATDDPCVMTKAECGQFGYTFDPLNGVYTAAGGFQLNYRGRLIYPNSTRMMSVSMNITKDMGVLFRKNGSSPALIDLSDWIIPEEPGGTIEMGGEHRDLSDVVKSRGIRGRATGGYLS